MSILTGFMPLFIFLLASLAHANPHWDQRQVPRDRKEIRPPSINTEKIENDGEWCLRVRVDWSEDETYKIGSLSAEKSATPALFRRVKNLPKMGSYLGIVKDPHSGRELFYDSIGTGKEYRKLARALTFRYPLPQAPVLFELWAEDPQDGVKRKVLSQILSPDEFVTPAPVAAKFFHLSKVRRVQASSARIVVYSEGYKVEEEARFLKDAKKVMESLVKEKFPGMENLDFYAAFAPSAKKLGAAQNLGLPVRPYDSFLGLYYPYWNAFGRWYHVVYPTSEEKFRRALASFAYDYPIAVVASSEYWGVGNYMSHTAIPATNSSFTYLLLHELGHFFGLNEEYTGGGRTELEFAPDMREPWSPNITFLADGPTALKWNSFVVPQTPIPTPRSRWGTNKFGAYVGGYADSQSSAGDTHIPGLACVMDRGSSFCPICSQAIKEEIAR